MSQDGNYLGDSELGSQKLGPTTQQPGALETTGQTPRERFDQWVKSAFPTDDGTTWDAFLDTLAAEFETELSVRQNLYAQQYIDTATAGQLDKIGALFQLDRRQGETDALYRRRIKLQLPKYTSGATIDEILSVSAHLLDCDPEDITLVESFDVEPARFDIFVPEQLVKDAPVTVGQFEDLLQDVKAAGVKAVATVGKQFTHRSEYAFKNGINDPERAYASEDGSINGGPYADIITARHRDAAAFPEAEDDGFGMEGFGEDGFGE